MDEQKATNGGGPEATTPKVESTEKPPTAPKAESDPKPSKRKKRPGYVTKSVLNDKERKMLIKKFNDSFNAQLPETCRDPKVLKNMQTRLQSQVYK